MREPLAVEQLDAVATTSDPLSEAIRRADLAALWRAIETLPRQQRDALLLREFGGLTYGELSAALAVSGPAVESLLFRARQRLRGQLRTVYASVSGASWIDALIRLAAGGGAPVAAKVAVLGVGAAVVGGTAVVVPNVLDNHHPHNTQRNPAAVVHRSKPHPPPLLVERVVATPTRIPAPAQVTPAPAARVSSGDDTEQQTHRASEHGQGGGHGSNHVERAETSHDRASRRGADRGDRSGSGRRDGGQTRDVSDDPGSSGEGSDGGSSPAIPPLPTLPPLPLPPSGDRGGD